MTRPLAIQLDTRESTDWLLELRSERRRRLELIADRLARRLACVVTIRAHTGAAVYRAPAATTFEV